MSTLGRRLIDRGPLSLRDSSTNELRETAQRSRNEDPRWRLVFPVTSVTRDFIVDQMPALLVTYGVAIALILAAALAEGLHSPSLIAAWLIESGASIAARVFLIRKVARATMVEVVSSRWLRLLPVLAIVLAAIHWSWTATLFIAPHLNLTTVVVLLTFMMLSVACLGMTAATPIICAAYLIPMWGATAFMMGSSDWVSGSILLILGAALAGSLWCAFYIVVSRVRRYLVRSDEAEILMRQLQERTAEVEVLRAAAAADLETRAAVFSSASHDVRQRIHGLKLLAHASAEASGTKSPLRRMTSLIEELEVFVTEVLQFVRFDSGSKADRLTHVRLQEVLQTIELQFEAMAARRGARLRTRATPLCIRTDPVMLGRVLENLVSNALKFTRKDVLVVARQRGKDASVEVWDQGEGLDKRLLDNTSVSRPTPAGADRDRGFGLGLTIVQTLVKALDYRIELHSHPGRGTRVRILIPARHVIARGRDEPTTDR